MDKHIHMIGNAHIDPVWLWRWPEGLAEIKATFRAALDRMDEFPGYIFTSACAFYYRWVEENAPDIFAEIQTRVGEGRWAIAGGMWIQSDCNIPSGESFVRQLLYSQLYFREKFGKFCRVGYNVDSFGHNGMLPQLLKKAGIDYYVFMRPDDREKKGIGNLFWWESPDGSRVLTFKLPFNHGDWFDANPDPACAGMPHQRARILATADLSDRAELPYMCFYGVGNHGGGPTISALREIEGTMRDLGDRVLYSSPEQFFGEAEKAGSKLPLVKGDLQHHASGCYAAHSGLKAHNCRAESRLAVAEKLMALARALLGGGYDFASLRGAWEQVMLNQFHDILAGTSVKSACEDAVEAYGEALSVAARIGNAAFQKISWQVDTMGDPPSPLSKDGDWMLWGDERRGTPVIVFNPCPFDARGAVVVNKEIRGVVDREGRPLALQRVRGEQTNKADKYNSLFLGVVPALGYSLFWIFKDREFAPPPEGSLVAGEASLENEHLRVEFDPQTGWMTSLRLKPSGREVLRGPGCIPLVIDESDCDTWAHGIFEFRREVGRFSHARITVTERGPLRATLRVVSVYGDSTLRQDFSLYADAKHLEVSVALDLRERHRMIKLSFPLELEETAAFYEMPYGHIQKEADGLEEPAQRWVSLCGKFGDGSLHGFALVNTGKYSFDMKANDLRMTIARTPIYADHFGDRDDLSEYMDQGRQDFRYAMDPWSGGDFASLARLSLRLNQDFVHVVETYHRGGLPHSFRGIDISSPSVLASVFKRGEDDRGYVLRCHKAGGEPAPNVRISLPAAGARVWSADFGAQEIKSFFVPDDPSREVREIDLLERDIR